MICLRELTNSLGATGTGDTTFCLVVLAGRVLLDSVAPAELIRDLAALDALELLQKLDAGGTRLIAATLELELVVARAHGDALDRDKSGGGAGGHDLVEGGDLLVLDLMKGNFVSSVMNESDNRKWYLPACTRPSSQVTLRSRKRCRW